MKPVTHKSNLIILDNFCPIIQYILDNYERLFDHKKSEATRATYKHNGKHFVEFLKGEKVFKSDTLERFVYELNKKLLAQNTKAAHCTASKIIIERVNHFREDLIPDSIYKRLVKDIDWIKGNKESTRKGQSDSEIELIKDAIFEMQEEKPDSHQFYKCTLALFSIQAMRVSDVCTLRLKNLNFNKRLINLEAVKKKGEKSLRIYSDVREILQSYIGYFDIQDYLFPHGDSHLKRTAMTMRWKRFMTSLGLPDYCVHDFRHSVGTKVSIRTGDAYAVTQALYQSNVASGQRYIDEIKKESDHNKLNRILKY